MASRFQSILRTSIMQLLELIRHGFNIDRLNAAAIERGARARYTTI